MIYMPKWIHNNHVSYNRWHDNVYVWHDYNSNAGYTP